MIFDGFSFINENNYYNIHRRFQVNSIDINIFGLREKSKYRLVATTRSTLNFKCLPYPTTGLGGKFFAKMTAKDDPTISCSRFSGLKKNP